MVAEIMQQKQQSQLFFSEHHKFVKLSNVICSGILSPGMAKVGFMSAVHCGFLKLGLEIFPKWNQSLGLKTFL